MPGPTSTTVVEEAQQALSQSPHVALRALKVDGDSGRLLISGQVATFFQKQQAQETVRAAVTDRQVVNEVVVDA